MQRFKTKFKVMPNGCWQWTSQIKKKGYGVMEIYGPNARRVAAHRISYELHKGPIPDGLMVMHTCDNTPCVNPDHLVAGTALENMHDAMRKKRWLVRRGEATSNPKLNADKVKHIRRCEMPPFEYASLYGVDRATIRDIQRWLTWCHIPPE